MRRVLIGLFVAMGLGIAFYAGFVTAAVQKSAFHASFNIILARDILRATPVSSKLRSDARLLLEAAILTLGADRPYVIRSSHRHRIDRSLDMAGKLLATLPGEERVLVPSRGTQSDHEWRAQRQDQIASVVAAARERMVSANR